MIGFYLHRRAFTLIEVLIAVLVLALGLLGLAAVFPVVLREQRTATDTVQGLSAQRSVENYLLSHKGSDLNNPNSQNVGLNDEDYPVDGSVPSGLKGWARWRNRGGGPEAWSPSGQWWPPPNSGSFLDTFTGDWQIAFGVSSSIPTTTISIGDRLLPADSIGIEPQYVWDIVGRRLDMGMRNDEDDAETYQDDAIQLAVFIRPIDRSIRVGAGQTLRGLITSGSVSAVAVDSTGRPTFRGLDETGAPNHAAISLLPVLGFYPLGSTPPRLDRVVFETTGGNNAVLSELASQVGQKFVDSFGDIHTVVGLYTDPAVDGPPVAVVLEPPMRPEAELAATNGTLQVLVSPQIPASVSIITIPR